MYQSILVPVDGSEPSKRGLKEALELGSRLDARLRFIFVLNKAPWVSPESTPELMNRLVNGLRGSGESILHDALTAARAARVEADIRLIEALGAEAGECIIQEARSWPADLIVCGTHGRRGFFRVLMGSDAEYIVRNSPVPVMLVRADTR